ncbi:MAG: DUF1292 domain-containing protein [Eubacteriales bacterium]|nr:DUF1292 domain-containing protein [Eubacteriales bacterium]
MKKYESIPFLTDDGMEIEFCIIEQTKINGVDYLLVSEAFEEADDEEETTVYIMKENAEDEDGMKTYEMVEDEAELTSVFKVFEELMKDMDFETE